MFTKEYDKTNVESILRHARQLQGHTLREYLDGVQLPTTRETRAGNRGQLGNEIEKYFFGYEPNSNPEPDFPDVGLELKVTPLKRLAKGVLTTKERLVLSQINFHDIVSETWDENSLLKKLHFLLLMFYVAEKDVASLDLLFELVSTWSPSDKDMQIIRQDWETIVAKVRAGNAHELSEGDTLYLGACPKAADSTVRRSQPKSNIPAKPRAFALKSSYMRAIWNELNGSRAEALSDSANVYDFVINKFKPLYGKSIADIARILDIDAAPMRRSKDFISRFMKQVQVKLFSKRLSEFSEFEKSGIQVKNILLSPNGIPKESMSFPYINYKEIVSQEDWETSDIKSLFENEKHLWLVFKATKPYSCQRDLNLNEIIFEKAMFWNMPAADLDGAMQDLWRDTVAKIRAGDYGHFIKMSENPVGHIRPKARDADDLMDTPQGTCEKKKCFFLNRKYVGSQIRKHAD